MKQCGHVEKKIPLTFYELADSYKMGIIISFWKTLGYVLKSTCIIAAEVLCNLLNLHRGSGRWKECWGQLLTVDPRTISTFF